MDIPRTPKRKRMMRRFACATGVGVACLAGAGFGIQCWRDSNLPPPVGAFTDIGGRRIHYVVSGSGKYTFVLESGLGDYSATWHGLDNTLAEIGRVFVYDRAGLGWSDAGPSPRSAEQIVDDLHRSLESAAIPKPYVLVGHSLGGLTQMLYATRYPDDVCGLLLIDPSHPRQFQVLPKPPATLTFAMIQLAKLAPLGLPQLLLPGSDRVALQSRHVRTAGAEFADFIAYPDPWKGAVIDLHNVPVCVLTSGASPPIPGKTEEERREIHQARFLLHESILAASTSPIRHHEMVPGSSHYIHYTNRDAVMRLAREFVSRIEDGTSKAQPASQPTGGR